MLPLEQPDRIHVAFDDHRRHAEIENAIRPTERPHQLAPS